MIPPSNAKEAIPIRMPRVINIPSFSIKPRAIMKMAIARGIFVPGTGSAMAKARINTNKPMNPSGIRIGTPALTTRGMKEDDMRAVGRLIANVIREPESEEVKTKTRQEVLELTAKYPMYPKRLKENKATANVE